MCAWGVRHDEAVGRRADPRELIWQDGPALFGFLVETGFAGPEPTDDGIAYHRPGLHIEIRFLGGQEPEVATTVISVAPNGDRRWASLDCLYVACRCGVLQDVPGNAPNQRTAAKRVRQHAQALRRVLPRLLDNDLDHLLRRCQGRLLPEP
jgi:hypothetical protein